MTRKEYGAVRTALWHAAVDRDGVSVADDARQDDLVKSVRRLKEMGLWDIWTRNQLRHTIRLRSRWY